MNKDVSRRYVLLVGSAMILSACGNRGQNSARSGGMYYVVQIGDTLSYLHRRSGLTVEAIVAANELSSAHLRPGTKIFLPGVSQLHEDPLAARLDVVSEPQQVDAVPETAANDVSDHESIPAPLAGGYALVPRSAWTSRAVGSNNNPMGGVQRITLHHTGEHAGMDGLPDVEVIRRIESYHRNERHWAAIGYHFIVGRDAKIYEGRPAKYQGAHVSSKNANNLGISVIGDFQERLPSPRQLAALSSFLDDMRTKYHVGRGGVFGHRELNSSICPGDALFGWLKHYRSA